MNWRRFFNYVSCRHRELHSFPTRRSSDLPGGGLPRPGPILVHGGRSVWENGVRPGDRARDRKSTRLNSSHQISSYAVFCLKNKMKFGIISIDATMKCNVGMRPPIDLLCYD